MTLPTLEKTWEHRTNVQFGPLNGTSTSAAAELQTFVKNLILDQTHFGYDGTINEISPGATYELVATTQAGHQFLNPTGSFLLDPEFSGLVGRFIELRDSTNPANDGIFPITAVINGNTIRYTNATGVAGSFGGNYRISTGKFTAREVGLGL